MKKTFALLTALFLLTSTFTACESSTADDALTTTEGEQTTSAAVESTSAETTEVVETTTVAETEELPEVYPEYFEIDGEVITPTNASFEDVKDDSKPASWGISNNGEYQTIDTEKAHTGENSLRISMEKAGASPWCALGVSGLKPGAYYEISCFVNTAFTNDERGAGIKIEQYKADGSGGGGDKSFNYGQSTNDRWNELKGVFQVSPDVTSVRVYARLYSTGTAWFDDFSIKQIGEPQPYSNYIDHVFHYPEEEFGNSYIRLNDYYAPDSEAATSVVGAFKILDGEEVVFEQTDIPMTDGEACLTYPVSALTEKAKQYKAVTTLHNKADGEQIREWKSNLYVYDRPEYMNADGTFNVEGEPFYPIFGYHASKESYPYIAEAGINCPTIGYGSAPMANEAMREEHLSELEKYGLKGLFGIYIDMHHAADPYNLENTKKLVEKYKDDPRIFAWALMDEPLGGGMKEDMVKYMEEAYVLIRSIDTKHPIYYVDYGNFDETIKYSDIFVADIYAQGNTARSVSGVLDRMNAEHSRIATFELASTYQSASGSFPPMRTIRGSVLRGLEAGGINGTGYYSISDAFGQYEGQEKKALYEDEVWSDMITFNSVELPLLFELFNETDATLIATNSHDPNNSNRWYLWQKGDEFYAFAHNRGGGGSSAFKIPLESKDRSISVGSFTATPIGLTQAGEIKGEEDLEFKLEFEDAAIYKITPEG